MSEGLLFNVKWTHFQLCHGEFPCSTFTYIFVIAHLLKQFSTYIKLIYFDKNECIQDRVFHKDVKKGHQHVECKHLYRKDKHQWC